MENRVECDRCRVDLAISKLGIKTQVVGRIPEQAAADVPVFEVVDRVIGAVEFVFAESVSSSIIGVDAPAQRIADRAAKVAHQVITGIFRSAAFDSAAKFLTRFLCRYDDGTGRRIAAV